MRLCTIRLDGAETAAVVTANGIVPVASINAHLGRAWPTEVLALIERGLSPILLRDAERTPRALPAAAVEYGPLYRRPRKIWGIGLNYRDHAADLSAPFPTEPASFMKGDHTIIGQADTDRVAARVGARDRGGGTGRDHRAALPRRLRGGRHCGDRRVLPDHRHDRRGHPAAQSALSDTRSKNFDTFFSFGPELITPDEVLDVMRLQRRHLEQRHAAPARTSWPTWPSRRSIWWRSIRTS